MPKRENPLKGKKVAAKSSSMRVLRDKVLHHPQPYTCEVKDEAKREPSVPQALEDCANATQELEDTIAALERKLSPILLVETATSDEDQKFYESDRPVSSIQQYVLNLQLRIRVLNDRINRILPAIDL